MLSRKVRIIYFNYLSHFYAGMSETVFLMKVAQFLHRTLGFFNPSFVFHSS